MIFKRVTELNQKERRFFIEEVEVFIRLIEVFCEKNEVENNENTDLKSADYKELYDIGVIKQHSDVKQMKKVLKEIQDGTFAKNWLLENQVGRPMFNARRRSEAEHQIEKVGQELRGMMSWIDTKKLD